MKQLTQGAQARARDYLYTYGRAIDQARYAFHFAGGTPAAVLAALAPYQNEDGGFGHALEPDLRTPASSAVATQQGLAILHEVGAPATEPLVQRAIGYLLATLDHKLLRWPIVPPAVADAPHAPWWTYGESAGSADGFRSNPRAALIGFLYTYASLAPAALLDQLLTAQLAHLDDQITGEGVEMHALACYLVLVESPNLPAVARQTLLTKLRQVAASAVVIDPAEFGGYGLFPLDVAPTPQAPLAGTVAQRTISAQLDYLIDIQQGDGAWPIPWSWAFVDAAAWAQAAYDWQGYQIVHRLRTFAAWGRLEK